MQTSDDEIFPRLSTVISLSLQLWVSVTIRICDVLLSSTATAGAHHQGVSIGPDHKLCDFPFLNICQIFSQSFLDAFLDFVRSFLLFLFRLIDHLSTFFSLMLPIIREDFDLPFQVYFMKFSICLGPQNASSCVSKESNMTDHQKKY